MLIMSLLASLLLVPQNITFASVQAACSIIEALSTFCLSVQCHMQAGCSQCRLQDNTPTQADVYMIYTLQYAVQAPAKCLPCKLL